MGKGKRKREKGNILEEADIKVGRAMRVANDPFGDIDKDTVRNFIDCDPFDAKKHGVEPSIMMADKLASLPIYVTDRPIEFIGEKEKIPRDVHPIMSKKARKKARKARERTLSMLKKYPAVVGEIEKKRPGVIVFTSQKVEEKDPTGEWSAWGGEATPTSLFSKRGGTAVVHIASEEKGKHFRRIERAKSAVTAAHELKHISQYKRLSPAELKKKRKGEYEERPIEKEATRAEERFFKKRIAPMHEDVSKEQIEEGFRTLMAKGEEKEETAKPKKKKKLLGFFRRKTKMEKGNGGKEVDK